MGVPAVLKERYRIGPRVGQGGMGEVYRAYDQVLETDAAVKILAANSSRQALDLFDREWRALRDLHHGNIVSIYDRGEFRDGNLTRPYFVMPFLNGRTLYDIIHDPETRLSVPQVIAIMSKVCEGISAAHGRGIIHRDIKPGNIFVLEGGAVQIIDFGVAHLSDDTTLTTLKGTTPYIAPELLDPDDRRQPSARTDLFSLAVVCYEVLTGVQPFERGLVKDTIRAILRETPKPACDCNPEISVSLSQVLQKSMAKSDTSRYSSVAEFAEKLQKAFRNEPLPEFDRSAIELRLRAISDLLARGRIEPADSMLRSIESEGYSDAAISTLRLKIEKALEQRTVEHLLETVQSQREAGQYLDALSTLDRVLQAVPGNVEAMAQKTQVETEWIQMCITNAHRYSIQRDYAKARSLLHDAQKLRPRDTQIIEMLAAVSRAEENELNLRKEKELLYQEAQKAFRDGEIKTALEKLGRIAMLQQQSPASPTDRDLVYQQFLHEVQAEENRIRSAYAEIQAHVSSHKYSQALAVCDQMLVTNPGHPLFLAARLHIEHRERQVRLEYIREVCARSEEIADLEVRVGLLHEALAKYPTESQLQELLRNAKGKRDLINSAVAYARKTEERGDFSEALERWKLVREFHPRLPGVDAEVERARRRHDDQVQSERKGIALRRIDQLLEDAAYEKARAGCDELLIEFPNDKQVLNRLDVARESAVHAREAEALMMSAQSLLGQKRVDEAVAALRQAYQLDGRRESIRQSLSAALVEKVRLMGEEEWESADVLIREAVRLQPNDVSARSLATLVADRRERAVVDQACVSAFKISSNPEAALAVIDEVLVTYPANTRLLEQREKIMKSLGREDKVRAASVGGRIAEEQPGPPHEDAEPQPVLQAAASDPWTDVLAPRDTTFSLPSAAPEPRPAFRPAPWWQPVAMQARRARHAVTEFIRDLPGRVSLYVFRLEQFTERWLRRFAIPLKPRAVLVGAAAFAAVVLVVALVATGIGQPSRTNSVQNTAVPAVIPVTVQLSPASAHLFIDGKPVAAGAMPIELSAGVHKFEGRQPGYRAIAEEHEIQRPLTLALQLQAVPARLRLSTDDRDASIRVDGQERGVASGGEFTAADIPAGEHTIEVAGQKGSGSFAFQVEPGRVPALSNSPSVKTAGLFVAATFSGTAFLRSNISTAKLTIDGQPAGQLQDGILEVSLPPGEHEIAIQNEPASLMKVSAGDEPVVSASMWWIQQKLSVETRMKQAQALADQARYEDALRLVDEVLRESPQHEPARRLKTRLSEIIEALRKL